MMTPVYTLLVLVMVEACKSHPVATESGLVAPDLDLSRGGRPYYAFRGIPYARAPIDDLRFAEPQEPEPWRGVRQSIPVEPICIQYNIFVEDPTKRLFGQEDCLYLSVFTPNLAGAKLPVMVYIHEGGFHFGGGSTYHGPQFFMDRNIVLVMFNYRLGAQGFMSFEEDWMPGNLGLKDQVMALRWVRKNIAQFGGDPESITIFGQSAGAASVHFHMISPMSRDIFKRAIVQSGSALSPWALVPSGLARYRATTASQRLGCPTERRQPLAILACLRNVTAKDLTATHEWFLEWHTDPSSVYGPVIEANEEGSFLTEDPFTAPTPDIPLMAGYTTAEGSIKVAAVDRFGGLTTMGTKFNQITPLMLLYKYTTANPIAVIQKIREFYFESKSIGPETAENITNMISDAWIIHPVSEMASKHKGPVFLYEFDYLGQTSFLDLFDGRKFAFGPAHCDDLLYLFNLTSQLPHHKHNFEEKALSESLVILWTNFAKYGNPTPRAQGKTWSRLCENGEHLHIFKKGLLMEGEHLAERKKFWNNLIYREDVLKY